MAETDQLPRPRGLKYAHKLNDEVMEYVSQRATNHSDTCVDTAGVYPYNSGELARDGRVPVHVGNVGLK